jgi:uncharacterized protein YeaO (DUF488 family)
MSIRVVRLGTPRHRDEGLRLGTVRRPPRGVRKEDFARLNYYDVWVPDLAPTAELVSWFLSEPGDSRRWGRFQREYRRQMHEPPARHLIELLAALSKTTDFSIGCYCEDEARCHRSLLRELLDAEGAKIVK